MPQLHMNSPMQSSSVQDFPWYGLWLVAVDLLVILNGPRSHLSRGFPT